MKYRIHLTLLAITLPLHAGPLFLADNVSRMELKEEERKGFDYVEKDQATKRMRVIRINESALFSESIEVELFGGQVAKFPLRRLEKEGRWKGEDRNNRMSIRKISGGRFSGYVYFGGHIYSLTPLSKGRSILSHRESKFACGTEGRGHK